MYCIKTGCKERQKYIHIFQNSLKYSSASLSVSWKRLYNFSNCAVAIQWLACMQFIAMQANDWISNPLPNEQNADAQQTQKRVSAGFANVGVRLDAQKSVQPHSWNFLIVIYGVHSKSSIKRKNPARGILRGKYPMGLHTHPSEGFVL